MASLGTIILCGEAADEWLSGGDRGREHELQAGVDGGESGRTRRQV